MSEDTSISKKKFMEELRRYQKARSRGGISLALQVWALRLQ